MTFNHGVPRSNRGWVTKYADVAELADAIDLGSISREWGFNISIFKCIDFFFWLSKWSLLANVP